MQRQTAVPDAPHIGYLVPQFPGQTHIFFWRELQSLRAMGTTVTVFSTTLPPAGLIAHDWSRAAIADTLYLGKPDVFSALGAALHLPMARLLREARAGGYAEDLLMVLAAARQLLAQCRSRRIGHVHVHSCGRAALIAALAQEMGGPTYSLTLHGPLEDYGPGQPYKWRGAAFATIITRRLLAEVQTELAGSLPPRLVVRPMGVDVEALTRETPYAPALEGAPLRLFSCARLNRVKGHQDLMQAVRLLLDRGIEVMLDIAGEDDDGGQGYRRELEALRDRLGLHDNVTLLGAIDSEDVRTRLLGAHVFVLASFSEPLGVAYMEAMSCGVPTIGTDAGGVSELIEDGVSGRLVAPRDPEALAAAIEEIAGDPDLAQQLGIGGRARIVSAFRASLGAETILQEVMRIGQVEPAAALPEEPVAPAPAGPGCAN